MGNFTVSQVGGDAWWQRKLDHQLIIRLKDNLIDYDVLVDDCRVEVDEAVARLHAAIASRDTIAQQLADLVARLEVAA